MATANSVVKIARSQIGVKESPANSNRQKYGAAYGWNGTYWCAQFVWWCGMKANAPIAKSASAAYIQDLTVSEKDGSWVMEKNGSHSRRMSYAREAMPGDIVSFDFGAMDAIRDHVGIVESVDGDYIICIEGNTSKSGSQSNGGMVCRQKRSYNSICSAARPAYAKPAVSDADLAVDGEFGYQSRYRMQRWLGVKEDADVGPKTIKALQTKLGITQDGLWCKGTTKALQKMLGVTKDGIFGKGTVKAFQKYLNKQLKKKEETKTLEIVGEVVPVESKAAVEASADTPAKKKTNAQKLNDLAITDAYAYKTSKKKYAYPSGKPKKHYKQDLNKAYPNRKKWWKQTAAGAACDVFVPTVIRAAGVDKKMPHGLEYMIPYLEKQKKLKLIKPKKDKKGHYYSPGMLKGGDIVVLKYKGGGAHTFFIVEKGGKKYIAEAQYHGKTYPHISKVFKTMRKSSYKMLRVYRAK